MIFSYRLGLLHTVKAFWKKLVFRDGSKNSRKLHCSKIMLCNRASIPSTVPLNCKIMGTSGELVSKIDEQAAFGNKPNIHIDGCANNILLHKRSTCMKLAVVQKMIPICYQSDSKISRKTEGTCNLIAMHMIYLQIYKNTSRRRQGDFKMRG